MKRPTIGTSKRHLRHWILPLCGLLLVIGAASVATKLARAKNERPPATSSPGAAALRHRSSVRDRDQQPSEVTTESPRPEFDNDDDLQNRRDWFYFQRAYPLDTIPAKAREKAFASRPVADKNELSVEHIVQNWTPIGPAPSNAYFFSNEGKVSGRINSIAVSPADSQRILIGSATGGIWRSTDGGSNFTPVSDAQPGMAVGAIAFAPGDATVVYAGLGDLDNGYLGSGVLKSTNSGDTWSRVDTSGLPTGSMVTSIAVDPTNSSRVFLTMSTGGNPVGKFFNVGDGGLYFSNNGGSTWIKNLSGNMSTVVFKPGDSQTLFITWLSPTGGLPAGLWRTKDGGSNWTAIDTPNYNISVSDMRVAVTNKDPKKVYVYGGGCTTSGKTCNFAVRFDFSSDSGDTFKFFTAGGGVPQVLGYGSPLVSVPGPIDTGQFSYNLYLAADPNDANTVYIGARDVYRSTDGGQNFNNVSKVWAYQCAKSGACSYQYNPSNSLTHSDQQSIAISPSNSNNVYIGNDGGLYLLQFSSGSASVTSLNGSLTLSQFVGYAVHPTNDAISYAGAQDNGQQVRGLDPAPNTWKEISNGDGGDCVIDFADPTRAYTSYVQGALNRFKNNGSTPDGNGTGGTATPEQIANMQTFGECTSGAAGCQPRLSFYPPLIGASFEKRLYFGSWRLFTSTDGGSSWSTPTTTVDATPTQDIVNGGSNYITALGVGRDSSTTKNVIYAGSAVGTMKVSLDGGVTFTAAQNGLPNRWITSVFVDQSNPAIAYATVSGFGSGHVFKTTNSGGLWDDISGIAGSGGLSDVPVNTLVVDPNDKKIIYVGTDIGVYRSKTDGSTWQEFDTGMPPVPVMKLVVQPGTKNIHAATYGRGAYELISNVVTDTIDGFVKLADGTPLSGVTVTLSGTQGATATTGAQGHYFFFNLIGGSYAVTPAKTGYIFAPNEQDINVQGNMTLPDFVVTRQYNATTDFSLTNPSGVWSYGYSNSTGFHRFTVSETNENGVQGLNHWANATGESEPAVRFNATSDTLNYYVHIHHPNNELSLHPGPNCERSVLRFTAPNAGTFDFVAVFEGIDDTPTTTDTAIAVNGATIQTGQITAFGKNANGGSAGGLFAVALNAGDTIDFSVGCGNNNDYHEDSTGLLVLLQQDATVTTNRVFGRVTDSTGQPVSGVMMSFVDINAFFALTNVAFTDASGNYSFANVDSSRTFKLTPAKAGYLFSPPNRTVANPSGSYGIADFIATQISTGSNGRIALSRSSPSPTSVITMDSTGQNEQNLGPGQKPQYSFDGSRIMFVQGSTDSTGLFTGAVWTMNADGSNRMAVTDSSTGQPLVGDYAQLSPDGTKLVSTVFTNSPSSVISVRDISFNATSAVASNRVQLTASNELCFTPAWQPLLNTSTGRYSINGKIVFAQYTNSAQDLELINANGTGRTTISSAPFVRNNNPSFSYDGAKIIFDSDRDQTHPPCVWVMNADGSNPQKVTNGFFDGGAKFSPDGKMIVFVSSVENNGDALFVSNADGSGRARISTGFHDSSPSWGVAQPNPVPAIATTANALSPTNATAGTAFTLTVNGSNFVSGSVVQFNGLNESTTFTNANQLVAQIPVIDNPAAVGSYPKLIPVRVVSPAPGGGPSNSVNFTINAPPPGPPTINTDGTGLSPASAPAGSTVAVTINGTNFSSGATAKVNGASRPINSFVNANQLIVQLTALDTQAPGVLQLSVSNPGGATSNAVNFTVVCPAINVGTYPAVLPSVSKVTAAFNYLLVATGGSGSYNFSIISGSLPAGLKLVASANGPMISGIATTAGAYTFTVKATDTATGCNGSRTFTITIDSSTAVPTDAGSNVSVTPGGIGSTTITYNTVNAPGMTNATPIDLGQVGQASGDNGLNPSLIGPLPPGYQLDQNSYAVDVTTTATVSGPITVCMRAPWVGDQSAFAKLRVLHGEQGALVDRTISQNYNSGSVCAQVNSLSPFVLATTPNLQFQFNASTYSVNEGGGTTTITVNRTGDTSTAVSVRYATSDGTAKEGKDYTSAFGVLNFAAGETSKTFTVLIIDNAFAAGTRTVNLTLSNPTGATLSTQSTAVLNITDNDTSNGTTNPIDQSRFFVQLHYFDFLGRYPDQGGWDFWTSNIDNCTPKPSCVDAQRINTSAAYFLSIEFQQTGYLVERIYRTAYGSGTGTSTFGGTHQFAVPVVRFSEFLPDTQQIGAGVVVGQGDWQTALENNKQAFTNDFVQRSRFTTAFPTTMTPAQFVDKLNQNAGGVLSASDRTTLIALFGSATDTSNTTARAQAVRQVAENATLNTQEFNRAFVLMQYFGYLRRDPNGGQDTDYTGFDFWLTKLNQFNGNYNAAEMVKAFITSTEYRQRFGP